jgi:acyl-CoA thioesterase
MNEGREIGSEELARYEAIAKQRLNESPFYQLIGLQLEELRPGYSRFRLPIKEGLLNVSGIVHGGALASIADAAMGVALATLLDPLTHRPITVEMKVNYLAPVRSGALIAEGRVSQKGSTITVTQAEVRDEGGQLTALAMGTFLTREVAPRSEDQSGD